MTDRPLRFCIVGTFYPPYNFGGDGIYAYRLANGLARLGHQVTVLHSPTAYEMLAGGPPEAKNENHANVQVAGIRTPLGMLGLLAVQQTGHPCFQGPALRHWLNQASYDVIHYNNVSLLGGPQVFRYGAGLKLCTLIEHWLVCPMHTLWRLDREVCTKPTCVRCTLHGRRPPQFWRYTGLMRQATRSIDAFIGPSLFTMRKHRECGIRGTMIQLPLFCSEPNAGSDMPHATNHGRPYYLFVGRLETIKGGQTLIPVFRNLHDTDLLIAGDGTLEQELRRQANGAQNIKFLGRVDTDQLQNLYRNAIATLIPSLCYETFGVVAAESFANSTPVIAYAHSSLEEIVTNHGGGLTYRSQEALKNAIHRMLTDAALRQRLGREGRDAYEKEFSEAVFLRNYLAVIHNLLEQKRTFDFPRSKPGTESVFAGRTVFY